MRKSLLFTVALTFATSLSLNAKNQVYTFGELGGTVYGVSHNGKYVVGGDDDDNVGFIWLSDDPENITTIKDCVMHAASNDGVIVGSFYESGAYTSKAGYYVDGEWYALPLSDDLIGESFAMSISSDGKYIGGYQFTYYAQSETGGRYYPCRWVRDDFGEYQLEMYNNITLPDHQGFATGTITEDGRILAGQVFCGFGSRVPAMLIDGEFVMFNKLEVKNEPWYYKGEIYGYADNTYIDGFKDYSSTDCFYGSFLSVDIYGNFYGTRTRATDVKEDGSGTLLHGGFIYNKESDTWTDGTPGSQGTSYYCGINGNYISTTNGGLVVDGVTYDLVDYFGLDFNKSVAGLAAYSDDETVSGGTSLVYFEATGEYLGEPFFIKFDKPVTGVNDIVKNTSNAKISTVDGKIVVTGADKVAIYNTYGQLVSNKAVSSLPGGIYIVKADNTTAKVAVK
jgi:hypothetical protein